MNNFKVGDLVEVHPRIRHQVRSGFDLGIGMILGRSKEPPGWNMIMGSCWVVAEHGPVDVFWSNVGILAAYIGQLTKVEAKNES